MAVRVPENYCGNVWLGLWQNSHGTDSYPCGIASLSCKISLQQYNTLMSSQEIQKAEKNGNVQSFCNFKHIQYPLHWFRTESRNLHSRNITKIFFWREWNASQNCCSLSESRPGNTSEIQSTQNLLSHVCFVVVFLKISQLNWHREHAKNWCSKSPNKCRTPLIRIFIKLSIHRSPFRYSIAKMKSQLF